MGKLLLVGCGKMGGAMLDGWLARGLAAEDVIVAEPVDALRPRKPGLRTVASTSDVSERPAGGGESRFGTRARQGVATLATHRSGRPISSSVGRWSALSQIRLNAPIPTCPTAAETNRSPISY